MSPATSLTAATEQQYGERLRAERAQHRARREVHELVRPRGVAADDGEATVYGGDPARAAGVDPPAERPVGAVAGDAVPHRAALVGAPGGAGRQEHAVGDDGDVRLRIEDPH